MARIKESKEGKEIFNEYNRLRVLETKRQLTSEEFENLVKTEKEVIRICMESFGQIANDFHVKRQNSKSKQRKKLQPEFELIEQINGLIKEVGGRDFKARELRLFNVLIKDLSAANLTRIFRDMK